MPFSVSIVSSIAPSGQEYTVFPFYKDGKPLRGDFPRWGMSLRAAGSMRFRWNERNSRRDAFLARLACTGNGGLLPVPLELVHSKTVCDIQDAAAARALHGATGDGIITGNRTLLPVVTVADCMPLYLCDGSGATGVFGVFHSGWKGTGIIAEGIALAEKKYGARREELCVAVGAHIRDCCYIVDEERAGYFAESFTPSAVTPLHEYDGSGRRLYRLSLLSANLACIRAAGIRECNIVTASDCTACTRKKNGGNYPFGSFRREAAFMPPSVPAERRARLMTVQAAFCGYV